MPVSGFSTVERPGPTILIYRRRDAPPIAEALTALRVDRPLTPRSTSHVAMDRRPLAPLPVRLLRHRVHALASIQRL